MSISKQQLKSIVKECLLEILSEGVGSSINEAAKKKSFSADSRIVNHQNREIKNRQFSSSMNEAIKKESMGNNVLANILADTAATTLPAMLEGDMSRGRLPPTGQIEKTVAAHTPEQLFGEDAASKWSQLAFAGNNKK